MREHNQNMKDISNKYEEALEKERMYNIKELQNQGELQSMLQQYMKLQALLSLSQQELRLSRDELAQALETNSELARQNSDRTEDIAFKEMEKIKQGLSKYTSYTHDGSPNATAAA